MNQFKFKVVSYITSTDSQPYIHGYYDTEEHATEVKNKYNKEYSTHNLLYAKVESI